MKVRFVLVDSFKRTAENSIITEYALALGARVNNKWYGSGSAIIIAPHLAITAAHVVDDGRGGYWNVFEKKGLKRNEINDGEFAVHAAQIRDKGKTGAIWDAQKICFVNTDIAFFYLAPNRFTGNDYKWRRLSIDLYPPKIGSKVFGFGYADSLVEVDSEGKITWQAKPFDTEGEVIEVYPEKRDSVMAPFPCFLTSARFDASMSGGPVFNEEGSLCGIVSTGFDGSEPPLSLVASLWPAMATEIDLSVLGFPKKYPILELAREGFIHAKGWEKITLIRDQEEKIVGIHQELD